MPNYTAFRPGSYAVSGNKVSPKTLALSHRLLFQGSWQCISHGRTKLSSLSFSLDTNAYLYNQYRMCFWRYWKGVINIYVGSEIRRNKYEKSEVLDSHESTGPYANKHGISHWHNYFARVSLRKCCLDIVPIYCGGAQLPAISAHRNYQLPSLRRRSKQDKLLALTRCLSCINYVGYALH